MDIASIRNVILTTPLQEQPVTIDAWKDENGQPVKLIIRELTGKAGSALVNACSDSKGKIDQEALVAGVFLATLRSAEDANKNLIFGKVDADGQPIDVYDAAYRDVVMDKGLGNIMQIAQQSIKLSGLNQEEQITAAKNGSGATIVEGSLTPSPQG